VIIRLDHLPSTGAPDEPHCGNPSWGCPTNAQIDVVLRAFGYGVPRKLKCAGCQIGDHCNGEDDNCYCECTEQANPFP